MYEYSLRIIHVLDRSVPTQVKKLCSDVSSGIFCLHISYFLYSNPQKDGHEIWPEIPIIISQ